jgi:hypothetical protein
MAAWLQHHCRLRKSEARRIARLARFLARLPEVEDALRAGAVGMAHLEVLAEAHRERFHQAWVQAAPLLLDYAARARFEDFARQVRRFADRLAPKEAEDRFDEGVDDRYVTSATTLDGFGFLRGWLDPFAQQVFTAEHQRLIQELFEADWAAAQDVLGRDPEPLELVGLTRSCSPPLRLPPCGPSSGAAPTPSAVTAPGRCCRPTTPANGATVAPPTSTTANPAAAPTIAADQPARQSPTPRPPRHQPTPSPTPPTCPEHLTAGWRSRCRPGGPARWCAPGGG